MPVNQPKDEYTLIGIDLGSGDQTVLQCSNCGAHVIDKPESEIKHYANCKAGESKYWEKEYSKEASNQKPSYSELQIKVNIATDDRWLYRSITAIYSKQTEDEKAVGTTVENNGMGFTGADASILSSFAEQLLRTGSLSEKQRIVARKKMLKYAGQLKRITDSKL